MHVIVEETAASAKVPRRVKFAWGIGSIGDGLCSYGLTTLILPIYNIGYGINAFWLGFALCIPRLIDAIMDPIIGNFSDNLRTRWGRRRPMMLIGGIVISILLPLVWLPPFTDKTLILIYFGAIMAVFSVSYTCYTIPFQAMGYEFTNDYDEKTRVQFWRLYTGVVGGIFIQWLYKLTLLPVFGGTERQGIRYMGPIMGVICLCSVLTCVLFTRERYSHRPQERIRIGRALFATISNRPFALLMATYLIVLLSLWTCSSLTTYINIYYIFAGNKQTAVSFVALSGTIMIGAAVLAMVLANYLSHRFGKKSAMLTGLVLAFIATMSYSVTLNPGQPWLQFISVGLFGLGLQGCWLMVSSMTADICDVDEWKTGLRREGMYSAFTNFVLKVALAGTALSAGAVIKWSGYIEGVAPGADVTQHMKWALIVIQGTGLAFGFLLFLFYPLSRAYMDQVTAELSQRSLASAAPLPSSL